MLKIGYMDYANVYPIFHYLLNDKNLEFKKGFPADLNTALRQGEIDISPASSVEFCKNPTKYKIIDGISISAQGTVKSVCLFSHFKPEEMCGKKIFFTSESNTSSVLCRIVLETFYKVKPKYCQNIEEAEAELLIGDKALSAYYNNTKYPYIIDLGFEWNKFTNLPFVFALWLVNKQSIENPYFSDFCRNLLKIAEESPVNNATFLNRYIEKGLTTENMEDYWKLIDYSFTSKHLEALELFYRCTYYLEETDYTNLAIESSLIKF